MQANPRAGGSSDDDVFAGVALPLHDNQDIKEGPPPPHVSLQNAELADRQQQIVGDSKRDALKSDGGEENVPRRARNQCDDETAPRHPRKERQPRDDESDKIVENCVPRLKRPASIDQTGQMLEDSVRESSRHDHVDDVENQQPLPLSDGAGVRFQLNHDKNAPSLSPGHDTKPDRFDFHDEHDFEVPLRHDDDTQQIQGSARRSRKGRRASLNESMNNQILQAGDQSPALPGASPIQRPANYRDFLRAQRSIKQLEGEVSAHTNPSGDSSAASDEEHESDGKSSNMQQPTMKSPQDASRLFQSMRVLSPKMRGGHDKAAVDSMIYELENKIAKLDVDGHFKDKNHLQAPWYSVPIQRQRWGDKQILPDSDYGTLFFDLFFIGAIYNIQEMLLTVTRDDTFRSIIYFVGIFGPVFVAWETDMYYRSRYCVVDYAHRVWDAIRFVFITAAVLFIQPMEELASPQTSVAPFALTTAILMESIMHLFINVELSYKAQGDRTAIQNHTNRKIKRQLLPTTLTYLCASLSALVLYLAPMEPIEWQGTLWSWTDLPLTITAFGYIQNIIFTLRRKLLVTNGSADIRNTFVPNNIDYVIQRYNDWFLLLLGEVVMAIVEITDSERDYMVATLGALTTIVIHTLKFESEPGQAHGHALWRNISNATCFGVLTQFLSVGLVLFSVSYKILLIDGQLDLSDSQLILFASLSLAWVLFALELMVMTHKGARKSWQRLFHENEEGLEVLYWPLISLTLFKVGLFVSLVTLAAWMPSVYAALAYGVVVVILVAATRIVGWAFVFREEEIKQFVSKTSSKIASRVSLASGMHSGSSRHVGRKKRSGPTSRSKMSFYSGSSDVSEESSYVSSEGLDPTEVGSMSSFNSARKQAEVYDEMFDAVVLIDLKGFIVTVNKTALEVFGFETKDELIGHNVSMLVGGGEAKNHDAYLKAFHRKDKKQSQIGKQRILKAKRKDGTEFRCIIGIKRSSNGKYLVGYIRDMTGIADFVSKSSKSLDDSDSDCSDQDDNFEITNMGALENKSKKHLKRVLDDKAFDCIVVTDLYGVIQGVNATLVSEFGFTAKEELVGENIKILIANQDTVHHHDGYLAAFREKYATGSQFSRILGKQRRLHSKRRDGSVFECVVGVHDIAGADLLVGYIRNIENLKASSGP